MTSMCIKVAQHVDTWTRARVRGGCEVINLEKCAIETILTAQMRFN